jgi:hypothetical protein
MQCSGSVELERRCSVSACSMPMNATDTALAIARTSSGAEALAKKARPLKIARYLEPFTLAIAQLAYESDEGPKNA